MRTCDATLVRPSPNAASVAANAGILAWLRLPYGPVVIRFNEPSAAADTAVARRFNEYSRAALALYERLGQAVSALDPLLEPTVAAAVKSLVCDVLVWAEAHLEWVNELTMSGNAGETSPPPPATLLTLDDVFRRLDPALAHEVTARGALEHFAAALEWLVHCGDAVSRAVRGGVGVRRTLRSGRYARGRV